ncbi:hypothetical protein [Lysinibacillus sp. fls2-241-R2A-57]|uniref:hypothetical protein n=1 Tax=Lysinibacillus sp. fls2-241-R2A-57 TaxID=3040292 RepID=UPI002557AFB2|nr:hypothetical protein [Lysinibacillus sp. fls2-241-R2A-57]
MKKILVGIFIGGILGIGSYFLFGQSVSEEKLTYEGENENWKVEYTLNNIGKEEVQRSIN